MQNPMDAKQKAREEIINRVMQGKVEGLPEHVLQKANVEIQKRQEATKQTAAREEIVKRVAEGNTEGLPTRVINKAISFFQNIGTGAKLGKGDLSRQKQILSQLYQGEVPEPIPVEHSPELGFDPESIGQFLGRVGTGAIPGIGATIGGARLGAMAGAPTGAAVGSIVPGIGTAAGATAGTIAGGLGGAATGAGVVAAVQTYADAYNEARLAGQNHEQALEHAGKAAKISGGINAVAGMLGGVGLKDAFLKQTAKQLGVQTAGAEADTIAQNYLAKESGVDPNRDLLAGTKEAALGSAAFQVPASMIAARGIKNKENILSRNMPQTDATGMKPPPLEPAFEAPYEQKSNTSLTGESIPALEHVPEQAQNTEKQLSSPDNIILPAPAKWSEEPIRPHISESGEAPVVPPTPEELHILKQQIHAKKEAETIYEKTIEKVKKLAERPGQYLEYKIFNRGAPFRELGKTVKGHKLERENVPYRAFAFSEHPSSIIHTAFFEGAPKWNKESFINTVDKSTKGLMQAMEPILTDKKTMEDFNAYAYARRVLSQELVTKGKEKNITVGEAQKLLALQDEHPEFKQAFDDAQKWNEKLLEFGIDTGIADPNRVAQFEKEYFPFFRDIDEQYSYRRAKKSLTGQNVKFHKLTGGDERYAVYDKNNKLVDRIYDHDEALKLATDIGGTIKKAGAPTKNLIQNFAESGAHVIEAGVKNAAANKILEYAIQSPEIATPIRESEKSLHGKPDPNVVKTKVDGKDAYFKVHDPLLLDALQYVVTPKKEIGPALQTMQWLKNFVSKSIIMAPPVQFGIALKDIAQASVLGKDPMLPFKEGLQTFTKGFMHEFGKTNPDFLDMMAMGADVSFYEKTDPKKIFKDRTNFEKKHNAFSVGYDLGKKYFGYLEKLGRALESGHRLNRYHAALKKGATKAEAGFEGLDYMMYKMKGASDMINLLTGVVPFFQTHLAGIDKFRREFSHNKFLNRTAKMLGIYSGLSVLNELVNMMPDDTEEEAANNKYAMSKYDQLNKTVIDLYKWGKLAGVKDALIKEGVERYFTIDKPWEIGFVAGTMPELMVQAMAGKREFSDSLGLMIDGLMNVLSINPAGNPFIKVPIEQFANKQMHSGQAIVPRAAEDLEPALQYNQRTGETAKWIGGQLNVSPARLEHIMNGMLGITYAYPIMMLDKILEKPGKTAKKKTEEPFVNKFFRSTPLQQSGLQEQFYDIYKESDRAFKTLNALKNLGDINLIQDHIKNKKHMIHAHKQLSDIKKNLTDIYRSTIKIDQDENLNPEQKQAIIDKLNNTRNVLLYRVSKFKNQILGKEKGQHEQLH